MLEPRSSEAWTIGAQRSGDALHNLTLRNRRPRRPIGLVPMPRRRRIWRPNTPIHLISRFVDREFRMVDDTDRVAFLRFASDAMARWDWEPVSYALMSSHVHWALIAGTADPQGFFRSVHTRFAQHYHRRHGGLGPVLADRPAQFTVRSDGLRHLVAYHHRNPVEAGVVSAPAASTWTSHRTFLRLDPSPPWLDVERALWRLGFADTPAGRSRFDEFVMEVDLKERHYFEQGDLEQRSAEARSVGTARHRPFGDRDWDHIIKAACRVLGIHESQLTNSRRRRAVCGRWIVGTIARSEFRASYREIGEHLGISGSGVHQLLLRGRSRTEAAELDRLCSAVKRAVRSTGDAER